MCLHLVGWDGRQLTSAVLLGFDQVFLDMVESIVTDQDRQDVIIELQQFIVGLFAHPCVTAGLIVFLQDEDHSDSDRMAKGFYSLQTDIQDFLLRFDKYVEDKGEELKELRVTINGLQSTITE